jgi:aldehyde dehydrogenase (NAD+)
MFFAARCFRFYAGTADKLVGETKPLDNLDAFDFTAREPMGVCVRIPMGNSIIQPA